MSSFDGNSLTRALGLTLPIVQGPMGGVAGPDLVAAVSNAGGLGMLPAWAQTPEQMETDIRRTRELTSRPFAVNFRADLVQLDRIEAAIRLGAPLVHLFWGNPSASMAPVRKAGVPMLATVGDADAARAALDAGASALIAQGVEAGGHVLSEVPLRQLIESVLPLAGNVPVIAAGGLADADDVAEVMALGASGALFGTRFVATRESLAHEAYQQALLAAEGDATARSELFDIGWPEAPHRHLKNATFLRWEEAGRPAPGSRPGEGEVVMRLGEREFPRYAVMPPQKGMTGDVRDAVLYAGTGVVKVRDCPPAAEVVARLARRLA